MYFNFIKIKFACYTHYFLYFLNYIWHQICAIISCTIHILCQFTFNQAIPHPLAKLSGSLGDIWSLVSSKIAQHICMSCLILNGTLFTQLDGMLPLSHSQTLPHMNIVSSENALYFICEHDIQQMAQLEKTHVVFHYLTLHTSYAWQSPPAS